MENENQMRSIYDMEPKNVYEFVLRGLAGCVGAVLGAPAGPMGMASGSAICEEGMRMNLITLDNVNITLRSVNAAAVPARPLLKIINDNILIIGGFAALVVAGFLLKQCDANDVAACQISKQLSSRVSFWGGSAALVTSAFCFAKESYRAFSSK